MYGVSNQVAVCAHGKHRAAVRPGTSSPYARSFQIRGTCEQQHDVLIRSVIKTLGFQFWLFESTFVHIYLFIYPYKYFNFPEKKIVFQMDKFPDVHQN
jgi:hypothetical protein